METPQQVVKNLKKSDKCLYPGCKNKMFSNIMMPVGKVTERGQIIFPNESESQSIQSACPLCEYHMIFAEKGILNLAEINNLIQLFGPFPIVEVVEAVIEAKEFLQAMNKAKEKKTKNAKSTKKAK